MTKGEIANYEQLILSPQCIHKSFAAYSSICVCMWKNFNFKLQDISFSLDVFTADYSKTGISGKGLTLYRSILMHLQQKTFEIYCGKRRNCSNREYEYESMRQWLRGTDAFRNIGIR